MAKTIIQTIGPLYGEVVNGTVFGRPNGSIYVPSTNVVDIINYSGKIKNFAVGAANRVRFVNDQGQALYFTLVAQSQDIASNMRLVLASDSDLTTVLAYGDVVAGVFNLTSNNLFADYELTPAETYYVGLLLMNNNVPVATKVVEVVAE